MNERGQATPLLALVVVATGGLLVGLARFGADAADAARATAAADAAALAGAAEGREAAYEVAADNGAEVLRYESDGRSVEMTVRVGDAWTVAKARRIAGSTWRERCEAERLASPRPRVGAVPCQPPPPYASRRARPRRRERDHRRAGGHRARVAQR